jgi:hypothetical protein
MKNSSNNGVQTSQIAKNVGYSNNGGYTMTKSEYYRYLEAIGKRIERTPNGVIIH